jgi:hypothetical protein
MFGRWESPRERPNHGFSLSCSAEIVPPRRFLTDSGCRYVTAPSSLDIRIRLYAAADRVNIQPTFAVPR